MKKINVIILVTCILVLTGCGCQRKNNSNGVKPQLLTSISIATGDIGFNEINIDRDGNEDNVISLDNTGNILVTTLPNISSDKYEFVYSNEGIVEIDDDYNIKPLKVGKTTITAKTTDGSNIVSNKITIEVVK